MRRLSQLAVDCGGQLIGEDSPWSSASIDTRRIVAGELFIALRGPNFDGADFLGAAAAAGAAGTVAERAGPAGLPVIVVPESLVALQRAAAACRARYTGTVIGVAGSNGKTTCKEMIAAILGELAPTLATCGNLNNHIGLPLTLLRLEDHQRHAVIEMGANHPGELAALAALATPAIGIVTNAGAEHLEGFGSLEGAARAEADFSAREIRTQATADGFLTTFTLLAPQGEVRIGLQLAGRHNVMNALGAAAAAMAAGATLDQVATGLARMRAVAGRLVLRPAIAGAWLIDDSYNANPSSLQAAIDVLAALEGRRWLVLGDMGELGEYAIEAHAEAGRYARTHGVERLFTVGPLAARAAQTFGEGASEHADATALAAAVRADLAADVRVLVKGSRSNRLERVVDALLPGLPDAVAASHIAAHTAAHIAEGVV